MPEILNGKGEGVDIEPGEKGHERHAEARASSGSRTIRPKKAKTPQEVKSGTRVTIELEGQVSARPRQRR